MSRLTRAIHFKKYVQPEPKIRNCAKSSALYSAASSGARHLSNGSKAARKAAFIAGELMPWLLSKGRHMTSAVMNYLKQRAS